MRGGEAKVEVYPNICRGVECSRGRVIERALRGKR